MTHESDGVVFIYMLVMISLVVLWEHRMRLIPSSVFAVALGMAVSSVLGAVAPDHAPFEFAPEVFLYILLPPILLNSSLKFKVESLKHNWVASLLHASVGTLLAMLWIFWGIMVWTRGTSVQMSIPQALLFASILAPTDTVATMAMTRTIGVADTYLLEVLENESVMNDALAVVLVRLFKTLHTREMDRWIPLEVVGMGIFSTSAAMAFGYAAARLVRRFKIQDMTSYYLSSFLVYGLCECVGVSGILGLFVYGSSIHPPDTFKESVQSISTIIEAYVYLMLGLALHTYDMASFGISFLILLSCICGRVLVVFMLGMCLRRRHPQHWHMRSMMFFSLCGVRGAISYALCMALNEPFMKSTTFVVILSTIFAFGTFQKCMFRMLL